MNDNLDLRLSRIDTSWQLLRQAHTSGSETATAAQRLLIERYGPAVRRYLLAGLRDAEAADELLQEFSLALVRSDFHRATPERGRFRDYVKTVLFHLVNQHHRRRSRQPQSLDDQMYAEPLEFAEPDHEADRTFYDSWRTALLSRIWDALADANATYHQVLLYKAQNPQATSQELAANLSTSVGKPFSAAAIRQSLHRARELFANLLVDEVARTLTSPTLESLQDELRELDLLKYCSEVFARRSEP